MKKLSYILFVSLILILVSSFKIAAQCVGDVTNVSITTNIGCVGGAISWDGPSGGLMDPANGNAPSVNITWQNTGTFRLKRTFPCNGGVVYSTYFTISALPSAPTGGEVNQQSACGQVTLNYTGGASAFWQTAAGGTDQAYQTSRTVTSSGTYYLRVKNGSGCWSSALSVSTSVTPIPSTPYASLSVSGNTCGDKTITATGTPPAGETWNWQGTNPNGTITSGHSFPYNTSSSGTYYLRAYNSSTNCWSPSSQSVSVTVNSYPSTPNTPTTTSNACGDQTLSMNGTPPGGVTWYWQGTSSSGMLTSNSNSTYTASSSDTYYIRAYNNSTGCWSPSLASVSANVNVIPATPSASISVSSNTCGDKTLTASGTAPANTTWNWEGTNANGTMTGGISFPYNATSSGNYYVRALNSNGCWSTSSQSVSVTVNSNPSTPNTPTTTSNACGDQTLSISGTPPGGVTWYWQDINSSGMSTTNSSTTATASSSNTYYLRAKNANCWSPGSASVYATVNVIPVTPTASISPSGNTCGDKMLTATGTPPANTTWNWQGINQYGEMTSGHTFPYNAVATGTYYLRAKTNAGCWSANSQGYTVTVNNPPAPNSPITTTNSCGDQTLSKNGTPPANTLWYWQGTNSSQTDYTSGAAIAATFTANSSTAYFIRARDNMGCWSPAASIAVTVNASPATPSTPTVSANTCGEKTLSLAAAPSGITWYWQGTISDGTSTASATPATYTTSGTSNYFVRARNNTSGCWSTASGVLYVPIDLPVVPSNNSLAICEFETMTLSTTGYPAGGTLKWYTDQLVSLNHTNSTYTVVQSPGTYTYKVKALSLQNCESANYATVTLTVPFNCDDKVNWTENTGYTIDVNGNPIAIGASKSYADGYGNPLQSQSKSFVTNQVLASQPVYDRLGNPSLNTLPAPINSSSFAYRPNFITNANGQKYSANDFDLPTGAGGIDNPNPVGPSTPGTLGWYYSTNNNLEPNTPITSFPYSRSYTPEGPDPVFGKSAGPGDEHRMGNNHETKSDRETFTIEELGHYYKLKHHFISNGSTASSISPGPGYWSMQGNVTVVPGGTYTYRVKGYRTGGTGNEASLYVGSNSLNKHIVWTGPTLPTSEGYVETTFTVPMECSDVVLGVMWNSGVQGTPFYVTESTFFQTAAPINTSLHETSVAGYKYISTDPNGKQAVTFVDKDGSELASATKNGSTYDNWSYSYYNQTGQVVATVAPNGVNLGSNAYPSFVTLYKYDHLGRLIESTATDEGTTQYVYSNDGKIRFSQNQEQRNATPKRFSYTNYDYLGRLIESGEYTQSGTNPFVFEPHTTMPSQYSVLNIVDNNFTIPIDNVEAGNYTGVSKKLDVTRCTDHTFILYDIQAGNLPAGDADHPSQNFTYGQVTRTENENATTWYSYDEFGQLTWTKQDITELGIKTIDYTYDFLGNVTEIVYQKEQADDFYHHYIYNADQQLTEVWTSLDGTAKTLRAKYYYYLHGPLKRVELASNVQGMDFVYTINGALKTINNSDPSNDPGDDGSNGFAPDVFGQTMYYYDNDYSSAGFAPGSQTFPVENVNQFGGALKGVSWHTPVDNNMKINSYAFTYDNTYQLNEAKFGSSVAGAFAGVSAYKESIPSYDKNGNIQSLVRDGLNGANIGNYGYVYEANTNKLDKVNHNSAQLVDYSYNAIGQMTQQVEGSETMKVSYNARGITKDVKNASNQLVVSYAYDDRGDLVKRVDYAPAGTVKKNTFYVRDASGNPLAIYEQIFPVGSIQLIEIPVYGTGRVVLFKPLVNTYFYEIGDHLGNVRAVIGTTDTDVYTATMESENAGSEIPPFKNVNETRVTSVAANSTPGGNEAVRLNNTKPAGPAISLKVSPGDVIDLQTYAYYEAGTNYNNAISSSSMITAIASAFGGISGAPGEAGQIFNSINNALSIGGLTGLAGTDDPDLPGAYLAYIVFDAKKSLTVPTQGGYVRVTENGNMAQDSLSIPDITIEQPGFMYVFVYNRSNSANWVYFDDMKVTHQHSPIVAGADYFPFGLPMEGREITQEDYRWGYQGQYSEEDSVTGWNQFQLRMYDARFGRWMSVDPYGQFASPFVAMANLPNIVTDQDGGWSSKTLFAIGFAVGGVASSYIANDNGANLMVTALAGLGGGILGGLGFAYINNIGHLPRVDISKVVPIAAGATRSTVSVLINNNRGKSRASSTLKNDGGRLGGHVSIVADDEIFGFTSDKKNIKESWINSDPDNDGYNRFSIRPETWHSGGQVMTGNVERDPFLTEGDARFDFDVTEEQMKLIKKEIEKIKLNPPDYGTFQERCTSIAIQVLRAGNVLKKGSRFYKESPFQFRRHFERKYKKNKVY